MAQSFQQEKQLENAFLQETAPATTSLETLASIRALQQFWNPSDAEYRALTDIAKEESRWYIAGATAIRNSPTLQTALGTGAGAAQKAGVLLKARTAEALFQRQIDTALTSGQRSRLKLDRQATQYGRMQSLIG